MAKKEEHFEKGMNEQHFWEKYRRIKLLLERNVEPTHFPVLVAPGVECAPRRNVPQDLNSLLMYSHLFHYY